MCSGFCVWLKYKLHATRAATCLDPSSHVDSQGTCPGCIRVMWHVLLGQSRKGREQHPLSTRPLNVWSPGEGWGAAACTCACGVHAASRARAACACKRRYLGLAFVLGWALAAARVCIVVWLMLVQRHTSH